MQGYTAPSLLFDEGFFGRSELNFNDNCPVDLGDATVSSGLLGFSDSLDRLDTASTFNGSLQTMDALSESDINAPEEPQYNNISGTQILGVLDHHHSQQTSQLNMNLRHSHQGDDNPFALDDDGNLMFQDMLHHHQIVTPNINLHSPLIFGGGRPRGEDLSIQSNIYGVTTQWEESLQDLQSLLALHGQHSEMIALPMPPETTAFNTISNIRGQFGSGSGLESSNGKVLSGDSDLFSLFQFSRASSSSMQLQSPAAPVRPSFLSNPSFKKGSGGGPVKSSSNILHNHHNNCINTSAGGLGLYCSSVGAVHQNSLSSFPYSTPSLVGSNYFNISPNLGNTKTLNAGKTAMQQLFRGSSIIDLEQTRDHYCEDNSGGAAAAARFSPSLFESANLKRGSGSEGTNASLLITGKAGSEPRGINHFATERQRREYLNEKYQTLRSLVPNPSKADRASIVADAIEYVKELKRMVQELQILVQEKQKETYLKERAHHSCGSLKRRRDNSSTRIPDLPAGGGRGAGLSYGADSLTKSFSKIASKGGPVSLSDASNLRTSWLERTSQSGTHVDVRVVHDEVSIKLTQRRRKGWLFKVMVTFYELQLDLHHANGATFGEYDVYLFNTKVLTLDYLSILIRLFP